MWDYRGKGPLAMESKTYVGNTCIRKGMAWGCKGKIAVDLPIRSSLAGGWRTRENNPSHGAPAR